MRILALVVWLLCASGCISPGGTWGAGGWPPGHALGSAARSAAMDPDVWLPLASAGLLVASDVDKRWSQDMAQRKTLFGGDAKALSSDLRDVATAAYLITALAAPSDSFADKVRGLGVGAGTAVLDGVLSQGLKDAFGRQRPDDSNDQSMPSGHASKAASRTRLARANVAAMDLPVWQTRALNWTLRSISAGTALARVEGEKHYLSDVLVGYALGNFTAAFMQRAFLSGHAAEVRIGFVPVVDGGALQITLPLR